MTALHRYNTEIRLAVVPGPLWKSTPIPTRPVAIMELLIGFSVEPSSSGEMNRQPNGLLRAGDSAMAPAISPRRQ
ncbi:hypothetical protein [Arthrobacter livingstonensis]|uniref:hypothetical protein n=1 Tax=Arthrobacter livingstonensis TaxID=670078 RepID=UPI001FE678F8|nr:hypothetical protein [Arthrobacter livingstonensis]